MQRLGTVLVFKPGISRENAAAAILQIASVLDSTYSIRMDSPQAQYMSEREKARAVAAPNGDTITFINEFEEDHGGPVWYIP